MQVSFALESFLPQASWFSSSLKEVKLSSSSSYVRFFLEEFNPQVLCDGIPIRLLGA